MGGYLCSTGLWLTSDVTANYRQDSYYSLRLGCFMALARSECRTIFFGQAMGLAAVLSNVDRMVWLPVLRVCQVCFEGRCTNERILHS
jgi:hypothetical protein